MEPITGWETVKLEDVCQKITVGHVGPMAKQYVESGIPFLRSQNIQPFHLDLSSLKYITEEFHQKLKKSALFPGDVAVVRTGYPGTACVIPSRFPRLNCADLVIISPGDRLCPQYLAAIFNSQWGKSTVEGVLVGVAQQHFNVTAAKAMTIALPPLSVQLKIAAVLSAYDDLIENNTRRIAILEEMAQLIYREWFVHLRFPGHEEVEMVEVEDLCRIPQDWQVRKVQEFGQVITGKTPSKKIPEYYNQKDMYFIKIPDMRGNIFCIETSDYLSWSGAESQSKKTLPTDSLCVSCIGTVGIVAITTESSQTNQQINSIIINNQNDREFLYFALSDLQETMSQYGATGATMTNLSKGKFQSLRLAYPHPIIIDKFHHMTRPMFNEIRLLQHKNKNLIKTRDLLLQRIISGDLDVSNLAIAEDDHDITIEV